MLAQEVKELPQDDELIFLEGCKPILARKNWFFKDKTLKKLTELAPVVVEPLTKRLAASSAQQTTEAEQVIQLQNAQEAKWLQ